MPSGMLLKSEGFASSLSAPGDAFPIRDYCRDHGIPYADIGIPIRLDTFWKYGIAFQERFVPMLEAVQVGQLDRKEEGFELTTETGEIVRSRQVVVASGIAHCESIPEELVGLPPEIVTHSASAGDLKRYRGRHVIIIGAGASAIDIAALLLPEAASVSLVTRRDRIAFHAPPDKQPRPVIERIRRPMSGLGPGWRSRLATDAPLLFHTMPEWFRLLVVRKHLGPAPGWWTRDQVEGKVGFRFGVELRRAALNGDKIVLAVEGRNGGMTDVIGDNVIAATGYSVDIRQLPFLTERTHPMTCVGCKSPILSTQFESSIPGLYFVGLASAASFGPMMRFAFGARYTARRLSRHLIKQSRAPSRHGKTKRSASALSRADL